MALATAGMACGLVNGQTGLPPAVFTGSTFLPSQTTMFTGGLTPTSTRDFSPVQLIAPYVEESDMSGAMGFSRSAASPWGFQHVGIDFLPDGDPRAFRAVCSGTVEKVELWQLETARNWQESARLVCNDRHSTVFAFEPMTTTRADGERQLENIRVREGQPVDQGDGIGLLPYTRPECHVDFGFYDGWERICPKPFFTSEATKSILRLIRREWPSAEMGY